MFLLFVVLAPVISAQGGEIDEIKQRLLNLESLVDRKLSVIDDNLEVINGRLQNMAKVVSEPVAFSAYLDGPMEFNAGDKIIFGSYWVNTGDAYDIDTGVFTCPVVGLYYFSYGVYLKDGNDIALELVRDGTSIAAAWSDDANWDQGWMSVIIPCNAGDPVYLRQGGTNPTIVGELTGYGDCIANSFTGFLLYEVSSSYNL